MSESRARVDGPMQERNAVLRGDTASPYDVPAAEPNSDRVLAGLAGPDADDLVDRGHEDLAVTDLAGAGRLGDQRDHLPDGRDLAVLRVDAVHVRIELRLGDVAFVVAEDAERRIGEPD